MYTKINFMDVSKPDVCPYTGEQCLVQKAISVTGITPKKVQEIREKNCTVIYCESLQKKAHDLLTGQYLSSLAALPKDWEKYYTE